jgi:3',5'-cyclic AMP phosphodiesterase CpdA
LSDETVVAKQSAPGEFNRLRIGARSSILSLYVCRNLAGNRTGEHRRRVNVSRIWDLRSGDADDNRTSPYGRGLWGVILSAALDFNIVKASIAFLALILGPALLVGVAPPLAVSAGRLKLHVLALGRTYPLTVLIISALVAAAMFRIGRPLVSRVIDHFWTLHYTLVFPLFVALRETIRVVAERIPGRPVTLQQLDRRRRAGSTLAALLFAAAGAGLAWTAGFSLDLGLIEAGELRPGFAIASALRNAATILGISTVIESMFWFWRELMLRDPVLDWTPGPIEAGSRFARVAHLSDLHVVGERYGYRMEDGMQGPQGNQCVQNAIRKVSAMLGSVPLDRVLITGDVTDAGTRAEWAELLDLLREHPEVRARMSFVPGNHDVNIVDRSHPALPDLPWSAGQALRKLRVLLALDEIQGDRAHLVDRASGKPGPLLRDYLRRDGRMELLRDLARSGSWRGRREMSRTWETIFPLVEPAGNGCGLILLNSNARSHFSLTNAIGVIDRAQLATLRSVLQCFTEQPWAILLHHQVVEYPLTSISLRDRIGLALINAPDVLAAIAPHARRILILHGHRHRDWIGACGELVLCSAPSVTMGSYGIYCGSFHVHQVAFPKGGGIRLTATERIQVA